MQDVRGRRLWRFWTVAATLAIGCILAGSLVAASGSKDVDSNKDKDDEAYKKKDVRVYVSGDGDAPDVWVAGDDDADDDGRTTAYLGVSTEEDTKSPDGGARVDSVAEDSPAAKAGIQRGDTIVSFGGSAIHGPVRLSEKIHAAKPGERVDIKVRRKDGKSETVSVEIGERPNFHGYWFGHGSDGSQFTPMPELEKLGDLGKQLRILRAPRANSLFWRSGRPRLGVELVETTPDLREFLGGPRESGVLIGKVLANTPAQRSGLKVGDLIVAVDGTHVEDAGELIEAMDDKEGKSIDIELVRDHKTTRVQVSIPKPEEEDDQPTGPRAMLDRSRAVQDMVRAHLAEIEAALHGNQRELAARDRGNQAIREAVRRRALAEKRRIEAEASRAGLSL